MTTELEKEFFDAYGIEPKRQCYYWDCPYSTGSIANDIPMNFRNCRDCSNPDKAVYPKIDDYKLLELLCFISSKTTFTLEMKNRTTEQLKDEVLYLLLHMKNNVLFQKDVKKIFEVEEQ